MYFFYIIVIPRSFLPIIFRCLRSRQLPNPNLLTPEGLKVWLWCILQIVAMQRLAAPCHRLILLLSESNLVEWLHENSSARPWRQCLHLLRNRITLKGLSPNASIHLNWHHPLWLTVFYGRELSHFSLALSPTDTSFFSLTIIIQSFIFRYKEKWPNILLIQFIFYYSFGN